MGWDDQGLCVAVRDVSCRTDAVLRCHTNRHVHALSSLTAEDASSHPLFWSDELKLSFLQDISDRVESESEDGPFRLTIEQHARDVVGVAWDRVLDRGLLDNLGKYRKYDFASARDLLRVIRSVEVGL